MPPRSPAAAKAAKPPAVAKAVKPPAAAVDPATAVVRLKITLDEVTPAVVRRVEVPLALTLDRLHLLIQAAMGWDDDHLYGFRVKVRGGAMFGVPDPDWDDIGDVAKTTVRTLLDAANGKRIVYTYDFGDDWHHAIVAGKPTAPKADIAYPRLVEAVGRCPPEDCGGPWGYMEMCAVLADASHPRHGDMVEWMGEDFDPLTFDPAVRIAAVAALAKGWSRKRRAPRSK